MASGLCKRETRHDGVLCGSKTLTVRVIGVGTGIDVYGRVGLTMRAMEGVVIAGAVAVVCLCRRVWSLRRAAAERFLLRTIERGPCMSCSLACSVG